MKSLSTSGVLAGNRLLTMEHTGQTRHSRKTDCMTF
jgi:hypothetical protein